MEHLVFTLVTFVLFTALVGIISGKIVKNSDDQKTAKGYFLAGNGLGGFFIAGSMLLTNLSAENLVGLSGQSYAAAQKGKYQLAVLLDTGRIHLPFLAGADEEILGENERGSPGL